MAPVLVGANVTVTAQLAPAARLVPQLLACANCLGSAPLSEILLIDNGAVLVLVTVTVLAALVVRIVWLPKATAAGATVKVGTIIVPVSATVCEVAGAARLTATEALLVVGFGFVGVKVTFIVQVAPAARLVPQLFVWANWLGFVPPRLILLIVSGAVPALLRVTV